MRGLILVLFINVLIGGALIGGNVYAQEDDNASPPEAQEVQPASGPTLAPKEVPVQACDPADSRLRYLEIRGSGFDGWALQRLAGSIVDVNGSPVMGWSSIWVSPQGQLTLEVNLCSDPFRGRPALAPGTYAVQVGSQDGVPIASTSLEIAAPPDTTAPPDTADH